MSEHNDDNDDEIILTDVDFHRVKDALDYAEIDHQSHEGDLIPKIRRDIEPFLTELLFALHDTRAIKEHQQWTIPMGLSCGMEAALIIRVKALGLDHDLEN